MVISSRWANAPALAVTIKPIAIAGSKGSGQSKMPIDSNHGIYREHVGNDIGRRPSTYRAVARRDDHCALSEHRSPAASSFCQSCALTIFAIKPCSSRKTRIISSEAGVTCTTGGLAACIHSKLKSIPPITPASTAVPRNRLSSGIFCDLPIPLPMSLPFSNG